MKLLVICLGNICRSPMAEGALRHRLAASALAGRVEVDSAGTGGWHAGEPPDPRAIACAGRHGVDIAGLRARQLQRGDFERFDWLLCADAQNLLDVRRLAPAGAAHRAERLLDWAGIMPDGSAPDGSMPGGSAPGGNIPDPYTGGSEDFERVWRLVDSAASAVIRRLSSV